MLKNKQREFEYDAFISYRHEEPDMTIAKKLIATLERYSAPIGASKNEIRKIRKVFIDREELPTTNDLSESIKHALQNSRFLIVICSPHVRQKPQWIENEIEYFTQLRGKQYIQTLLIEGEPEEAFPDSLLYEKTETILSDGSVVEEIKNLEFLAADIRPDELKQHNKEKRLAYGTSPRTDKELLKKALKLLKTERLRCLAPMFGCKFDNLYRRHMRRAIRNIMICSAAAILLLGGFLTYAVSINSQLTMQIQETEKQRKEAEKQAGIASDNEDRAIQNAKEATQQRIEAERQAELARINEAKATASSEEATQQRIEAEHQAELARINEEKAIASSKEASEQREIAETQAGIAKANEEKAVASTAEAEKQEKIAVGEKNNALKSQSLFLADLSVQQLENGDRVTAAMLALEALPTNLATPDRPLVMEAEKALRNALQMTYTDFIPQHHIRSEAYFKTVDINQDNSRLVTTSHGEAYACVWDITSGNVIWQLEDSKDEVIIAKFSPDGSKIVTSSGYHTIIWDAKTGKKLFTIPIYNSTLSSGDSNRINFSPDGSKIVISEEIYSVITGKKLYKLEGHSGYMHSAKFSPSGNQIVTASGDKTAIIWDAKTGKLLFKLEGHTNMVYSAEFSPDGSEIVTGSLDDTARIWNAYTGKLLYTLEGHDAGVEATAFSPDGKHILTVSKGETFVWNAYTRKQEAKITGLGGINNSAAFGPYNDTLVTASGDCKLWNLYTGALINHLTTFNDDQSDNSFDMSNDYYNKVIFSRDSNLMVTLSGKNIMVWQFTSDSSKYLFDGKPYTMINISQDNRKIIARNYDKAIIYDYVTGELLTKLEGLTSYVSSAEFSPDGSKVITILDKKTAVIWDVATGKIIGKIQPDHQIDIVNFASDNSKVLITAFDQVIVWDLISGKQLTEFEDKTEINAAEFSPDGSKIITAIDIYDTASVWNASTGKLLFKLEGHSSDVLSAKYSADGSKIVTGSRDDTALIWDAATGKLLTNLVGHDNLLTFAEFSSDGSKVVTASWDETAILWDTATGKLLTRLVGHKSKVDTAKFSPDGNYVVTASSDRTVIVWDVATGKPLSEFDNFDYYLDSAAFSKDGSKIIIASIVDIIIKDFKPLKDVLEDAKTLLGGHLLTDAEKAEFYLE